MRSDVTALFREYMGTGMIVIWYLVSLIYLWMKEKESIYAFYFSICR